MGHHLQQPTRSATWCACDEHIGSAAHEGCQQSQQTIQQQMAPLLRAVCALIAWRRGQFFTGTLYFTDPIRIAPFRISLRTRCKHSSAAAQSATLKRRAQQINKDGRRAKLHHE